MQLLPECKISREELLTELRAKSIDARALWTPLIDLPPYRGVCESRGIQTPKAKELLYNVVWLPTASNMSEADVDYVGETLTKLLS